MLQAYVDGSGTGDPERLVIAGFVADSEEWDKFSSAWKERLNEARIPWFKMNLLASKPEIAGYFYRLVEDFDIKAAIGCVVNTKELVEVERSIRYPAYITNLKPAENPYYWAVKYIVSTLAQYQHDLHLHEPVNFIFDEEGEKSKVIPAWGHLKAAAQQPIKEMMGDTPIYGNDEKVLPLQAADFLAWWILKWEREGLRNWANDLPFPWGAKKRIQRVFTYFGRRSFLAEISDFLRDRARTPEERAYAVSLMPTDFV